MNRINRNRVLVATGSLLPLAAMATPTSFESAVFDALTTKVGAVTAEAAPFVALVLGIYFAYRMVKRFAK